MAHGKLEFIMPVSSGPAFEAFFNHHVRLEWDTLLRVNYVEGAERTLTWGRFRRTRDADGSAA